MKISDKRHSRFKVCVFNQCQQHNLHIPKQKQYSSSALSSRLAVSRDSYNYVFIHLKAANPGAGDPVCMSASAPCSLPLCTQP